MKQLEGKLLSAKKVSKALEKELTKRGDTVKTLEMELKTAEDIVKGKGEEVSTVYIYICILFFCHHVCVKSKLSLL